MANLVATDKGEANQATTVDPIDAPLTPDSAYYARLAIARINKLGGDVSVTVLPEGGGLSVETSFPPEVASEIRASAIRQLARAVNQIHREKGGSGLKFKSIRESGITTPLNVEISSPLSVEAQITKANHQANHLGHPKLST